MSVQLIRTASGRWSVTNVRQISVSGQTVNDYETLGRIALREKMYYPERAIWEEDGIQYEKLYPARGYLLINGALAALLKDTAS